MKTATSATAVVSDGLIDIMCDFIKEDAPQFTFYDAEGNPVSFLKRELERVYCGGDEMMDSKGGRYEKLLDEFKGVLTQVGIYCEENLPENGGETMAGNIAIGLMLCDRLDRIDNQLPALEAT